MVFCWLEADNSGIVHAGEHLRVIIHIRSKDNSPTTVLLAAVTLCGNLHYDEKFLNLPKHSKSVINVGSGYGTILDNPKQSTRAIFICPSTVIMTNERIEEQVDYSYEWIMRIPKLTPPSISGTKCLFIKYNILLTVQLGANISSYVKSQQCFAETPINILPSYQFKGGSSPFGYFDLNDCMKISIDKTFIAQLSPATIGLAKETILDRYNKGTLPTLSDFKKFPRHPIRDIITPAEGDEPSTASQIEIFNALARQSQPISFTLRAKSDDTEEGGEEVIANVKLSKGLFRLGEEIFCSVSFPLQSESRSKTCFTVFQMVAEVGCTETIKSEHCPPNQPLVHRKVYRKKELATWLHRQASFSLSLPPPDAPVTFSSSIIEICWSLDLSFICSPSSGFSMGLTATPIVKDKKIVSCRLPFKVLPSLPLKLLLVSKE